MVERSERSTRQERKLERMVNDGLTIIDKATKHAPLNGTNNRPRTFDFGPYSVTYRFAPQTGAGGFEVSRVSPVDASVTEELRLWLYKKNVRISASDYQGEVWKEVYDVPYIERQNVRYKLSKELKAEGFSPLLDIMRSPHIAADEINGLMTEVFGSAPRVDVVAS